MSNVEHDSILASRDWERYTFRLGKTLGVPAAEKGLLTGAGAGLLIGGVVANDQPLVVAGALLAFIGLTA